MQVHKIIMVERGFKDPYDSGTPFAIDKRYAHLICSSTFGFDYLLGYLCVPTQILNIFSIFFLRICIW